MASSSMPFFFPPVDVADEHLVDGGLRDITPLGQAFRADPPPDEVWVVYASPFAMGRKDLRDRRLGTAINALDFLGRTIEILTNEIYVNDVDGAKLLNRVKANWDRARVSVTDAAAKHEIDDALKNIRTARIFEIAPEVEKIKDALEFDPARIRENYEYGRETARQLFPTL
jgi:NTE family protein